MLEDRWRAGARVSSWRGPSAAERNIGVEGEQHMSRRVYLDHNASTPVHPEVLAEMLPYFSEHFGNPSSVHGFGREARVGVDQARERVARFLRVCAGRDRVHLRRYRVGQPGAQGAGAGPAAAGTSSPRRSSTTRCCAPGQWAGGDPGLHHHLRRGWGAETRHADRSGRRQAGPSARTHRRLGIRRDPREWDRAARRSAIGALATAGGRPSTVGAARPSGSGELDAADVGGRPGVG